MDQTSKTLGALIAAFFIYAIAKGELASYIALITKSQPSSGAAGNNQATTASLQTGIGGALGTAMNTLLGITNGLTGSGEGTQSSGLPSIGNTGGNSGE